MNGLLSLLMSIIDIVLFPINSLISLLFPNLGQYISGVANLMANLLNGIAFVSNFMPPLFKGLVIISLTTLIYYYSIYWAYTTISKAWALIQKIKLW